MGRNRQKHYPKTTKLQTTTTPRPGLPSRRGATIIAQEKRSALLGKHPNKIAQPRRGGTNGESIAQPNTRSTPSPQAQCFRVTTWEVTHQRQVPRYCLPA